MWYHILLSSLLFNVAFFIPDYGGFLIIVSFMLLIPLVITFMNTTSMNMRKCGHVGKLGFIWGFIWGLVTYAGHFLWVLWLLLFKSHANLLLALVLYLVVVSFFSLSSGCWFFLVALFARLTRLARLWTQKMGVMVDVIEVMVVAIVSILATILYFLFLDHYGLWFLGHKEGYPFLSPLIPLGRYNVVLRFVLLCSLFLQGNGGDDRSSGDVLRRLHEQASYFTTHVALRHIKPVKHAKHDLCGVGQSIFHALARLPADLPAGKLTLFVAPESTYPYPLSGCHQMITLWNSVMPSRQSHFLIGSLYEERGKVSQAVYWLNKGRIKKIHVKSHCVAFVEKMPQFYKKCSILRNIFLKNSTELCDRRGAKAVPLTNDLFFQMKFGPRAHAQLNVIPQICSEFFFTGPRVSDTHRVRDSCSAGDTGFDRENMRIIFLFANDSWFVDYFIKIMENLVYIKSAYYCLPILYIGHTTCKYITV